MTRILLRALNAPALVLIVILGITLQTALFTTWPLMYFQPDVVLLTVLWCGLRRPFIEGGIIALLVADIAELHSAAPQGFFLITYMLIFLLIRGTAKIFVIPNLSAMVTLTMFSSIIWKIAGLGLLHLLGSSGNQWKHTLLLLFPGAIVEGILSVWAYRWLEKFDWLTYKVARSEENMDDELQLESDLF